jgi:outer membrane protein assembly factor BamB
MFTNTLRRLSVPVMLLFASPAVAEDWPRFLGSSGILKAEATDRTPTQWTLGDDQQTNVKWSTKLPGRGVSSPIVVGDRVFVTCYSGYGMGGDNESIDDLVRHVVCVNKTSGDILWRKEIAAVQPEDPYAGIGVPAHGYASHTPASDGESLFVFLGKSGVIAFDFDGKELWRKSVGTGSGNQRWGSSSSPILYNNLVIVNASDEDASIFAFDKKTGKEVWKQEANDLESTWSTPVMVKQDDGSDALVINVPGEVWAMNPETGKLLWYSRGTTDNSTAASLVVGDGVVYATGGRGGDAVAVRVGGKGDVNDTHVLWDAKVPGRFGTPVLHDGHLFTHGDGIVTVYDAKDGTKVSQLRLPKETKSADESRPGGPRPGMFNMDYASPVLIGENLYLTTRSGTVYVVTATAQPELIATNRFTGDKGFGGTPAVSEGEIFIRSDSRLYCLSKQ